MLCTIIYNSHHIIISNHQRNFPFTLFKNEALVLLRLAALVGNCQSKASGHLIKDVDVAISTSKGLLAGTHSKHGHISKRVNALSLGGRQSAVDDDTVGGILGVDNVGTIRTLDSRLTRATLVNLIVFAAIGGSANTTSDGVSWLPVGREVNASAVLDVLALLGVLRETGLFVDTNGVALLALVFLLAEIFGVGGSPDTKVKVLVLLEREEHFFVSENDEDLLESVAVISRNNNEGVLKNV